MEVIYKQIVILEVEIMRSETEPYHYQHTSHTINQYSPDDYKRLFAQLQVVQRLYGDLKGLMSEYNDLKKVGFNEVEV